VSLKYRADVDGLRAIAILPVVLYHFGVPGFSGGYVGVDVFFVISGFLITSLIYGEVTAGEFSLVRFYDRRIRRIFPALFSVLFGTSLLAAVVLFPSAFADFATTVAATAGFVSNFQFWSDAGYFDVAADRKPLLHTWSLAVEEQFYVLFPPLMMFIGRFLKGQFGAVLTVVFVASLALSAVGVVAEPSFTFYLLPTRTWELLLGSLIAVGTLKAPGNAAVAGTMSLVGILMIAAAVATFTAATVFPGPAALLPCVGAALIIVAGQTAAPAVNRLLSRTPFVFIGKISYSLYLWHWPLLVFAKYQLARSPTAVEATLLMLLSGMLSVMSWRFIEGPFRGAGAVLTRPRLFATAGAAIAAALILGASINLLKGVPQRFQEETLALLAPGQEFAGWQCPEATEQTPAGPMCAIAAGRTGDTGGRPPSFLVWGDSHARALLPAVTLAARPFDRSGLVSIRNACPPLWGVDRADSRDNRCRRHNDAVMEYVLTTEIPMVILVARWSIDAEGTRYGEEEGRDVFLLDDDTDGLSLAENRLVFARGVARTISRLRAAGRRVVVVGPVPEIGRDVPETLARYHHRGIEKEFGPTRADFEARNGFVLDFFKRHTRDVEFVYPHHVLCPHSPCSVVRDGKPLYADDDHLSRFGAETVSGLFDELFATGGRMQHSSAQTAATSVH
jgi:peptidoglycan/LPS O-acetylase OafA/YrhL